MRCLLFPPLVFACAVGLSRPAVAADPLLGMTLDRAKKADFFTFFNLAETATAVGERGQKVVSFKPRGGDFRDVVVVQATLGDGRIRGLSLELANSFVDDRKNGIFARDFAKSLLRQALTADQVKDVNGLVTELEWGTPGVVVYGRKPPKLPAPPTEGYQTYLGKQPSFKQSLGGAELDIRRPADGPEKGHVTITVSADK